MNKSAFICSIVSIACWWECLEMEKGLTIQMLTMLPQKWIYSEKVYARELLNGDPELKTIQRLLQTPPFPKLPCPQALPTNLQECIKLELATQFQGDVYSRPFPSTGN